MKYLDFDLLLERSNNRYKARVLNSPAGQAEGDFDVPLSEIEIENFLLKIGRPLRKVRRVEAPEMEAAKNFGGRLFEAVFTNEVRACFRSSLDEAEHQGMGLRLRLRMTNAPELTDLPWEYLYNPSLNRFFSLAKETPIVRYLELSERVRPIEVIPPLHVLVMISSPHDYPKLDVEREWIRLKEVLAPLEQQGLVTLERQDRATLSMLQRLLRQKEYHVFHFIGHGGFDKQSQDGVLLLEDEHERGRAVSGQYLGTLLHNHHPLRLAILNACEGGRTSRTDPFAGTAQSLVQQGIPAVIAMQFEISDEAAITFAQEFYTALTDNYPVDAALVEARMAIYAHGNSVEWGTPVLYMRSSYGQIFKITHAERDISTTAAPRLNTIPSGTQELPQELLQAISHPISEVREGAVHVLEGLLHGVHKELARHAETALKKLAGDDSRKVAAAAQQCLARYSEVASPQQDPNSGAALAVSADGMITIDERGAIEHFNAVAERMFGYSTQELLNQSVSILMPSPYRELHDRYIGNYVKTGQKKIIGIRREVYGRRKDGTTFPMDIAVNEVFVDKRRTFTAIVQDITARKQAEELLRKTKEAAEAAKYKEEFQTEKTETEAITTAGTKVESSKLSPKALRLGLEILAIFMLAVSAYLLLRYKAKVAEPLGGARPAEQSTSDSLKVKLPLTEIDTAKQSDEPVVEKPAEVVEQPNVQPPTAKTEGEKATTHVAPDNESARRVEESKAAAAREAMKKTKQGVPGSDQDKTNNSKYQEAEVLAAAGDAQFQNEDFRRAQVSFDQAKAFYVQAAGEVTSMLKGKAEVARKSMLEAKAKIDRQSYVEPKYQEARRIETEADKAYSESDLDQATKLYNDARDFYNAAAREIAAKVSEEQRRMEAAQYEIQSLIDGFKQTFESKRQPVLETSFKEVAGMWSDFFKHAEKINMTITTQHIQIDRGSAQVVLTFQISYEQRGLKQRTPAFNRIWVLEERTRQWVIISMTEKE
ncbi:MAG: CHAT domain-containing protein [bacterium]